MGGAKDVMDAATFGCVAGGWQGAVAADCDHIKTTEGIDRGLVADGGAERRHL